MQVPQVFRHQYRQRLADQLRRFIAEDCCDGVIGEQDIASVIDTHHGVAGGFDHHAMEFFPRSNLGLQALE